MYSIKRIRYTTDKYFDVHANTSFCKCCNQTKCNTNFITHAKGGYVYERNVKYYQNSSLSRILVLVTFSQSNVAVTKQALYNTCLSMHRSHAYSHTHTHMCAISHACVIIALPSCRFLQLSSHSHAHTKHGNYNVTMRYGKW